MQLFKRIFGSSAGHLPAMTACLTDRKKSILDLFRTDLSNISLSGFREGNAEVLMNGDIVQHYFKMLDHREYGIFDTMEIRIIGGKSVNAILRSASPGEIAPVKMKEIIDALYGIYGNDNSEKGCFDENDATEYSDSQLYMLFGRDWMDYPRYEFPVSLRRYPGEVYISIWGLTDKNIVI